MPSSLAWLDFSEADRQQAMDVIDLFREQSTVDELGFAPIRDTLADAMFPGTSTIQTRARYFLFVPWIMLECKRKRIPPSEVSRFVRRQETSLINALLEADPGQRGIIGREAKGSLKRMPSSVYWRGLQSWRIRLFNGSIDQFYKRLAAASSQRSSMRTDDGEPIVSGSSDWAEDLPKPPSDFLKRTQFDLSVAEAEFLYGHISRACTGTLLDQLLQRSSSISGVDFVWEHPLLNSLGNDLLSLVEHARCFALCAWGGPLLYARMVARLKGVEEIVNTATENLDAWREALGADHRRLLEWDRPKFWNLLNRLNPQLSARTRNFVDAWIDIAFAAGDGRAIWEDQAVLQLIEQRERSLKGPRARLRPENARARDRWQHDGSGGMMDYRWGPTQIILNDIIKGLTSSRSGCGEQHA